MNNKWTILAICILFIIGAFFALNSYIYNEKQVDTALDYKNTEYIIDGQRIKLQDGVAETEVLGSAAKITTRYFGNELETDLNNDSLEDVVFLLTQETGGSGTFFYVVAALNTENGYVGSEAYLLGDRISPQTTELSQNPRHQNVIVVNYVDRALGEPMTAKPSVGKSVWLKLDSEAMQFGIVEPNFEGEANPSVMSLSMKEWVWTSVLYNNGDRIEPNQPGSFVLTFTDEGAFSVRTDCNRMSGTYTTDENSLSFGPVAMTKMFCADSQENEFLQILEGSTVYDFNSYGELNLYLVGGVATFR